MDAFETSLKRAFAEAPEPEDAGFTVAVSKRVSRRERVVSLAVTAQGLGLAAAGAAVFYGLFMYLKASGPQIMASLGVGLAEAHSALSTGSANGALMGLGLTQVLIVMAAVAGGAAAIRAVQEQ